MGERWKKIAGFTDYEISTNGNIRSRKRTKKYKSGRTVHFKSKEKRLRKHPKNHFLMTDLVNDKGKRKTVYPHKLVAIAFIKNEHPRINKIVMHKDQDFTIFSVSMDGLGRQPNPRKAWLDAIEKDGLPWEHHVSDLKGWESKAVDTYGFQSIPYTVLVDKDGTILGVNLRGPSLRDKLKEILG